jgi:hypothetical protein
MQAFCTTIIDPVAAEILEAELTEGKLLRTTNFGSNVIYSVTHHDSPNIMREIGRLREMAFRMAGGGTGKDCDTDSYDTAEVPYRQLVVWDPDSKAILGGYRYFFCKDAQRDENGIPKLATTELFNFSEKFCKEYVPHVLELGRSFVHPDYQSGAMGRKGMFALDNLWDGLGALAIDNPTVKYFYGKVTMYQNFDKYSRDLILYFMRKHFPDSDELVRPKVPLAYHTEEDQLRKVFPNESYKENYKTLSQIVRSRGFAIPPLVNSYMNLSPTMRCFGTALNAGFGQVEETGILVALDEIYPEKKERHLNSYNQYRELKTGN